MACAVLQRCRNCLVSHLFIRHHIAGAEALMMPARCQYQREDFYFSPMNITDRKWMSIRIFWVLWVAPYWSGCP